MTMTATTANASELTRKAARARARETGLLEIEELRRYVENDLALSNGFYSSTIPGIWERGNERAQVRWDGETATLLVI